MMPQQLTRAIAWGARMARAYQRAMWNEKTVESLRACIDRGMTAKQTARQLSAEFCESFTRNAVIGKACRLNLNFPGVWRGGISAKEAGKKPKIARAWRPAVKKPKPPRPLDDAPIIAEPIPAGDVDRGCRYMHGDDVRARIFCGAEKFGDSSYCEHHFRRCHVPHKPRAAPARKQPVKRYAAFR